MRWVPAHFVGVEIVWASAFFLGVEMPWPITVHWSLLLFIAVDKCAKRWHPVLGVEVLLGPRQVGQFDEFFFFFKYLK